MKQGTLARVAILAAAVVAVAGCDSFRSTLGLERHVPDETQVVARPALTLPPDFNLRPPGTATAVSGEHESGATVAQSGTPGEQSLERSAGAGADGAPPKEEKGFFGRLFSGDLFSDPEPEDPNQMWHPGQGQAKPPADATAQVPAQAAPGAQATAAAPADTQAPPAPASQPQSDDKPGFFGRVFGSIFGDDDDSGKGNPSSK